MEYYSAAKKNKIMTFPGKWMDLRNITNSEKKNTSHVYSPLWILAYNVFKFMCKCL